MFLKQVHIKEFQSIRDSNPFSIGDITCLVGKNEAGKTAILQALYRLNPIEQEKGTFSVTDDYPRVDVEDYRQDVESGRRKHAIVVAADFELNAAEIIKVNSLFGPDALKSPILTLSKGYENKLLFGLSVDEAKATQFLIKRANVGRGDTARLRTSKSPQEALQALKGLEQTEHITKLSQTLQQFYQQGIAHYIYNSILSPHVPKFLYFNEYYQLRGADNIQQLQQRQETKALKEYDYPLLGLIKLARLDLNQLLSPGRTLDLKNKLEGAGNHLTRKIINYWSQNKHLQMRFDVRPGNPHDPEDMRNGTNIWGEVYDTTHWVSTSLGTRSRGFVWFFSFLAWYSELKTSAQPLVLLLDEPGLALHAKAQEDLLQYFEAEINGVHQLIYTTHSPFMVDSSRFDRVRIVQDKSIDADEPLPIAETGTKVFTEVLQATSDSLFPLQGALGYEIYQTLFVGPNSLVVEGVSDLLYLQSLSGVITNHGGISLDERWIITPVGGSDKVPTFVALLGAQKNLNIAVLMDYQKRDRQTIEHLYKQKLLKKKHIFTFADYTGSGEADVEDMFAPEFYLRLVNQEYEGVLDRQIELKDLDAGLTRITTRLDKYFVAHPLPGSLRFNHYRPARLFAEKIKTFEGEISKETWERFSELFRRLNELLDK